MKIFLIGFMGSGKTYWGKAWSQQSGLTFIDVDDIVENEQEKTIAQIFAEDGEDHFRNLETTALRSFVDKEDLIIATGGGTACFNDNMKWMNENGTSIYLQSSPQKILERLTSETQKRPLIKDLSNEELLFYIREKIKERNSFYQQAKIILNVDDLDKHYLPAILKG